MSLCIRSQALWIHMLSEYPMEASQMGIDKFDRLFHRDVYYYSKCLGQWNHMYHSFVIIERLVKDYTLSQIHLPIYRNVLINTTTLPYDLICIVEEYLRL